MSDGPSYDKMEDDFRGTPMIFGNHRRPFGQLVTQMQPMVLEYLPTSLGDFWGFYVGKYSSTMEHLGDGHSPASLCCCGVHSGFHSTFSSREGEVKDRLDHLDDFDAPVKNAVSFPCSMLEFYNSPHKIHLKSMKKS